MFLNEFSRRDARRSAPSADQGSLASLAASSVRSTTAAPIDDTVVLVPCTGGTPAQWQALIARLDAFSPVAIALAGHGGRPETMNRDAGSALDADSRAIARVCGDGTPVHLVGHSYGAAVALAFARRLPERVRSLTLIEPTSFHVLMSPGVDDLPALEEISRLASRIREAVTAGDARGAMALFTDYWGGAGAWPAMPDSRQDRLATLAPVVVRHFDALIHDGARLADYRRIDAPTLILCGARSPRPARAVSRLLAEAMPAARHRTLRDAGHMSPLTHPTEVNGWILDHLQRHRARIAPQETGAF